MDDLERAAELIARALDALSIAAARHPSLGEDFARRCEHLRQLRCEVDAAIERTRQNAVRTATPVSAPKPETRTLAKAEAMTRACCYGFWWSPFSTCPTQRHRHDVSTCRCGAWSS